MYSYGELWRVMERYRVMESYEEHFIDRLCEAVSLTCDCAIS